MFDYYFEQFSTLLVPQITKSWIWNGYQNAEIMLLNFKRTSIEVKKKIIIMQFKNSQPRGKVKYEVK